MYGVWMSSCVPYRTEEEDSGGIKGGEAGGADGAEEETSARGDWLGSALDGTEGRKKVSQAFLISLYPFISLCLFLSPHFHTASGLTLSPFFSFSTPLLDSSHCLSFSFLSRLYMSSHLSSFSFISFIVLYLSSAPSFHFCLFVCVLTIFSLLHLFTRKELGVRSVPEQSRLCHPTKRVGVKHRHQRSLPRRWNHIEANGCRETWIYVCCHPLIQALILLVHLDLKE